MASRTARVAGAIIGLLIALGILGAAVLIYSGWYSVAATEQHLRPTFRLLDIGLRRSVEQHSRGIEVPPLESPAVHARGFACFKAHCEQCHGAPGIARAEFAKGLLPVPSSLSQAAHDWLPAELYWITRHGIKMTGMPAWQFRLDEEALWATVAFLLKLPGLSAREYAQLGRTTSQSDCGTREGEQPRQVTGDPDRGRVVIQQYACTACHRIPGIVGPSSHTGPPLTAMGKRKYIAGILPNSFENMVRWLREPQSVDAQTAMPDTGLTDADARDIAAYLVRLQ
jgi:mono/diheme cytochrome c family protein